MRSTLTAVAGAGLVGALLLAGCSSSGTATETSPSPSDKAAASAEPSATGAALDFSDIGTTVASTGFDPSVNGFSFENWGERGTLDATAMVAMFGQANVCAEPTGSSCTLMPAAAQWLEQVNEGMSGGHCEGLAVLSQRLFEGDEAASDDQGNPLTAYSLAFDTPGLVPEIDYWWATQMTPEVGASSRSYRETLPSQIVTSLMDGMKQGTGMTLGLYGAAGGHAVTPTAISQRADGAYVISVYDNNYPNTTSYMLIDPATESWLYQGAALNPGEKPEPWTGTGAGTLDLTPMAVRTGPFSAPFTDSTGKGSTKNLLADKRVIMVTGQNGPSGTNQIGATFTIDGKTYDTRVPGTEYPDSVKVQPILGTSYRGVILEVEPTVSVKVGIVQGVIDGDGVGDGSDSSFATISTDGPDSPRVTVRQDPTETPVTLDVNENGGVTFEVPTGEQVDVNVSKGFQGLNVPLGEGTSLDVEPGANGSADLTFGGADGNDATFTLRGTTRNDRVVDLSGDFDPATGTFSSTSSRVAADDLDLAFLEPIVADQLKDQVAKGEITQEEADKELADLGTHNGSGNATDNGSGGGGSDSGGSGGSGTDTAGGGGGDSGGSGGSGGGDSGGSGGSGGGGSDGGNGGGSGGGGSGGGGDSGGSGGGGGGDSGGSGGGGADAGGGDTSGDGGQ